MTRISKIAESPPAAVESALNRLGRNIRIARLRRKLSKEELAAIAAYLGALWALGLLHDMREVADPDRDEEGKILEQARRPKTAPKRRAFDDDF